MTGFFKLIEQYRWVLPAWQLGPAPQAYQEISSNGSSGVVV
jgi:uncharacterized phage-associated protein